MSDTKLCSLCGQKNETPVHLFSNCNKTRTLGNGLRDKLKNSIPLGPLTPQSAIFGYTRNTDDINTQNHLLLLFKCFVFKYRKKSPNLIFLYDYIKSIADLEKASCEAPVKLTKIINKWERIIPFL